jgi:hypothetical protein
LLKHEAYEKMRPMRLRILADQGEDPPLRAHHPLFSIIAMRKTFPLTMMAGLALIVSACQSVRATKNATTSTPTLSAVATQQAGAGEAAKTPSPAPAEATNPLLLDRCNLLDSRDLASLFSSAEVVLPQPKTSQVDHVIFSSEKTPASETSCTYYVFHRPGKADSEMLQVTYWIDIPDQAIESGWTQVWTDAHSKGSQPVSGLESGAFFENGRLTFKKGSTYVTVEAISTYLNTGTNTGAEQQIQIEKQIAQDALNRLG